MQEPDFENRSGSDGTETASEGAQPSQFKDAQKSMISTQ